jgi:hypothetical protein
MSSTATPRGSPFMFHGGKRAGAARRDEDEDDDSPRWGDGAMNHAAIVTYFDSLTDGQGLETFRRYFSRNPDGTQIEVQLGANVETRGAYNGYVPLIGNNNTIYLGRNVNVATIVHEFGHQLDRWFKLSQGTMASGAEGLTGYIGGARTQGSLLYQETGKYNLDSDFIAQGLEGFAAKQFFRTEFFADLFMTAVLAGSGEQVFSLDIDGLNTSQRSELEVYQLQNISAFADCQLQSNGTIVANIPLPTGTITIPCRDKLVDWQDNTLQPQIDMIFTNLFLVQGEQ